MVHDSASSHSANSTVSAVVKVTPKKDKNGEVMLSPINSRREKLVPVLLKAAASVLNLASAYINFVNGNPMAAYLCLFAGVCFLAVFTISLRSFWKNKHKSEIQT